MSRKSFKKWIKYLVTNDLEKHRLDITLPAGKQNLALRGHEEVEAFIEMLNRCTREWL